MDERAKLYRLARRRVQQKKRFYKNLSTYISTMVFLIGLNWITSPHHWWVVYPMLGWGLGIVMHYFKTFGWPGTSYPTSEWQVRELARELQHLEAGKREEEDLLAELARRRQKEKLRQKAYDESDLV